MERERERSGNLIDMCIALINFKVVGKLPYDKPAPGDCAAWHQLVIVALDDNSAMNNVSRDKVIPYHCRFGRSYDTNYKVQCG